MDTSRSTLHAERRAWRLGARAAWLALLCAGALACTEAASHADAAVEDDITTGADVAPDVSDGGADDAEGPACKVSDDCGDAAKLPPCQTWGCVAGACFKMAAADGVVCRDGDACHEGVCSLGVCDAQATLCATPDKPCTVAACDPVDGLCKSKTAPDATACDDGDPCTGQDRCTQGACVGKAVPCACSKDADCVDDGNLCNGTLYCDVQAGKCLANKATAVVCASDNDTECAKNTCVPETGACALKVVAKGVACDDGESCTKGDTCEQGVCTAGAFVCECKGDADCKDDGDLCNGKPFCNVALGKCAVNPATVVTCPAVPGAPCFANQCQPTTGACALAAVSDGVTCDDGSPCTVGETCQNGDCLAKSSACSCKTDADCPDDQDLCNGTLACDLKTQLCAVKPGSVVVCDSGADTPCAKATCQPQTGTCAPVVKADKSPCDDGNACTSGDICFKGVCIANGVVPQCQCGSDAECGKFEDGDPCNGTLRCDLLKKTCVVDNKTVVACDETKDSACLRNLCDSSTGTCGLVPSSLDTACSDGEPCTVGDHCDKAGKCVAGGDFCHCGPHKPAVDCEALKGDGDACNGVLWCDQAKLPYVCAVKPGSQVTCKSDGASCMASACDPKSGSCVASAVADGSACASPDKCAKAAACAKGVCTPTTLVACDDKDPCTADACNSATGKCETAPAPAGTACALSDPCVVKAACKGGACLATETKTCTDVTVCTVSACDPKTGACSAKPSNEGKACKTGVKCATAAACAGGECKVTALLDCDDNKPCTVDACDPKTGACAFKPAAPGTACQSDDKCVTSAQCSAGACKANQVKACDDGNPCTSGTCDPKTGSCSSQTAPNGASCADANKCVTSATCQSGLCKPLKTTTCDDGNTCTADQCDPKTGSCSPKPVASGTPCSVVNKCVTKAACVAGSCQVQAFADCDDGNPCTSDGCDTQTGECTKAVVQAGTQCAHDDPCVTEAVCLSTACTPVKVTDCDDGNGCTTDACVVGGGCKNDFAPAGTTVPCYDGPDGTLGVGVCGGGKQTCDGKGQAGGCMGQVVPKAKDDCGGGDEDCDGVANEDCGVPVKLEVLCGAAQVAKPGTPVFQRLRVQVRDGSDVPLANKTVTWTALAGGTLGAATTTTDASGVAINTFSVGPKSGATYVVRVKVQGFQAHVDIPTKADAAAPAAHVNYPVFCDLEKVVLTGVSAPSLGRVRLVHNKDSVSGAVWFKKPVPTTSSFAMTADLTGYAAGYSFVLQSTSKGTAVPGGGYGDLKTTKLLPAVVLQLAGDKGAGTFAAPTLTAYVDGKVVGEVKAALPTHKNASPTTWWLDYDAKAKQLAVSVMPTGFDQPTVPALKFSVNLATQLTGGPMYVGVTAGNASAGKRGNKYLDRWTMILK